MTPVEAIDRRRAFCARLKSERERRGMSLAAIAEATKVKASLLEALERADLSRWPKGIYQRAFFREYVSAIGLPAEPMVGEFLDVFADRDPAAAVPVRPRADEEPVSLRLTFAQPPHAASHAALSHRLDPLPVRLTAAGLDMLTVAGAAALVSVAAPVAFGTASLALAPAYYLATVLFAHTPGLWATRKAFGALRSAATDAPAAPSSLPSGSQSPVAAPSTLRERVSDALRGRSVVREYVERLSEARPLTLNRQRQEDLAGVRRRRVEAANRADEISGVVG